MWVSQFLALGLGVVGWVLLGVGARHSWLRARWRSFASRAGVLVDAVCGAALGVTLCRGRGGGGGRGVVGDGTLARRWCFWVAVWIVPWLLAALVLPMVRVP